MSAEFKIAAHTNYDGDSSIEVCTNGQPWSFHPAHFMGTIRNLNCFAAGNPCDFPHATLMLEDGAWKVLVCPASMYPGADNSLIEFSVREFANMPKEVLENPTMLGVREYAKKLSK